ncbi:TIGR00730 family Rossman fold protein [Streptomyces sp. NPDC102441]|uniref:LOG family protein n=1 Tax=Streptomyces sp. NPDC102441 TaxID=3366176 RepID=UPI00382AE868
MGWSEMANNGGLSICVFCGASAGDSPVYTQVGYELGKRLAAGNHRLVYGAGGIGVMGAVARGVADNNGSIVGIIPEFLRDREKNDAIPSQKVVVTEDLARRKSIMMDLSDGFVCLPGGYGTLDELLEVISMKAMGIEDRPVVLVNTQGFWESFVELVDGFAGRRFLPEEKPFVIVGSALEAIEYIESPARARLVATME